LFSELQLQLQRHMEGVIVVEQDTTQRPAMMTGDIQHLQVLMKRQVMVEVMGSQSMVAVQLATASLAIMVASHNDATKIWPIIIGLLGQRIENAVLAK